MLLHDLSDILCSILKRKSVNTIALSLWSLDDEPTALAGLDFISDGQFSTALTFQDYEPALDDQDVNRPALRPASIVVPSM